MNKKITAAITAVGGYVPDFVLSNKELEKIVDTNDEWIQSRTGIKERRILKGEGKGVSDMAVEAVKEILKKKNLHIALLIIYIAEEELYYQEIEKKMIVSLQKLIEKQQ